jgi:branched-chain amino acid transport system ATP-binding protein
LAALAGFLHPRRGTVRIDGVDLTGAPAHHIARAGVALVPQGRRIFSDLSVHENLVVAARPVRGGWTEENVIELLPALGRRLAVMGDQLSGGEQQMLAIARALVLNPKLILLDEPTEGLAPIIVEELLRTLKRLFREEGMSGIVVEQHAQKILGITDSAILLERGAIVHAAPSATLKADVATLERYLGITDRRPVRPSAAREELRSQVEESRR